MRADKDGGHSDHKGHFAELGGVLHLGGREWEIKSSASGASIPQTGSLRGWEKSVTPGQGKGLLEC